MLGDEVCLHRRNEQKSNELEGKRATRRQYMAPYTTVRNGGIPSTDGYRRHGMLGRAPTQRTVAGNHRWDETE